MSLEPDRRIKYNSYLINNVPILAPDNEIGESYEDIDAPDTGRDETGTMHRTVVRYKVGKWSFNYDLMTKADYKYMESIFPDVGEFQFTRPSRRDPDVLVTTKCYRSKYDLAYFSPKRGMWKNYKFNIIEC